MSKRRSLVALLTGLAVVHTAVWFWATTRLRDGYAAWAALQRSTGWTVANGTPRRAGWPLAAELAVPDVAIGGGMLIPGGFTWRAEHLRLRLTPWHPRVLAILPGHTELLSVGALPAVAIAGPVIIRVRLDGRLPPEITGTNLHLMAAGSTITCTRLHAAVAGTGFAAEARGGGLPASRVWPLGPSIAAIHAAATRHGGLPSGPSASTARQQAALWRDSGGRIAVQSMSLQWGPLAADGKGTIELDSQLQPAATAMLHLSQWQAALDRLVQGGALSSGTALAVRAVLGLFARATPDGGAALPASVAKGLLRIGGVPVAHIRPIAWP